MTRIIIRAVPWRQPYVDYLTARLPHAEVCMDTTRNAMDTFMRSLDMSGNDGILNMEEDAELTVGFVEKTEAVIAAHRGDVVQFFSRRKLDHSVGSRWDSSFSFGICYYTPPGFAKALREFMPGWMAKHPEHPTGLDLAVSDFMRANGMKHWIHVPSLVQHRVGESAIDRRRARDRTSKTFRDPWL